MKGKDLRPQLIREIATKLGLERSTVEAIIDHQFDTAFKRTDEICSLEFSGLGKIIFNKKKAMRYFDRIKKKVDYNMATNETSEKALRLNDYIKQFIKDNEKRIS